MSRLYICALLAFALVSCSANGSSSAPVTLQSANHKPTTASASATPFTDVGTVHAIDIYGTKNQMVVINPGSPCPSIDAYGPHAGVKLGDKVSASGPNVTCSYIEPAVITLVGATPTPAPTATPLPTPTSTAIAPANHVLTMAIIHARNGGGNVSAAQAGPYTSWAANPTESYVSTLSASGIKSYDYTDGTTEASCSGCSYLWNDLIANPQYISRDCNGNVQHFWGDQGQDWVNVTLSGWWPFWDKWVEHEYAIAGTTLAAVLSDNNAYVSASQLPCGVSNTRYMSAVAGMLATTSRRVIFNGLSYAPQLLDVSNVIGGMSEGCYSSGMWSTDENVQLTAAAKNKLSICYVTNGATGSSSTATRIFDYASFMLVFNLPTSMLFEQFAPATSGGLAVYPETGLVPANPLVSAPASITGLAIGAVYAREYAHCFYRGSDRGACAAVVNPGSGSAAFPYPGKYAHTMVLSGSDVLDGGTVSFTGATAPSSLGAGSAVIAFH